MQNAHNMSLSSQPPLKKKINTVHNPSKAFKKYEVNEVKFRALSSAAVSKNHYVCPLSLNISAYNSEVEDRTEKLYNVYFIKVQLYISSTKKTFFAASLIRGTWSVSAEK